MKKSILIDNVHFEYEAEYLAYENTQPMLREEGRLLLHKVKELFDNKGVEFYLAFGTLLGAVRNKDIIPGDEDIDVFVDDENKFIKIIPYLAENGVLLVRHKAKTVYSFRMNKNCYIDVYILSKLPITNIWSTYCVKLDTYVTPKKYFKGYETIEFLGATFKCPKNPERLLEFWYGKDWRTPKSGHKFYYEVKSAYYWHWTKNHVIKKVLLYDYLKNKLIKK